MNKPLNIVTPCHGMPIHLSYNYVAGEPEVDEISCQASGCYNMWNPDGTVGYWQEAVQ